MRTLALALLVTCAEPPFSQQPVPVAEEFGERCDATSNRDTCPGRWLCRDNPDDYPWGYCTVACSTDDDCPDCVQGDTLLSPCARCEAGYCGNVPFADK